MGNTFVQVSNSFFSSLRTFRTLLHSLLICIASNNANRSQATLALSVHPMQRLPRAPVRCGVLCIGGGALYDIPWCTLFPTSCIWGCLYPLKLWLHGLQNIQKLGLGGIIPSNVLSSLSVDINPCEADPYLINALFFLSTFHWILCITFVFLFILVFFFCNIPSIVNAIQCGI